MKKKLIPFKLFPSSWGLRGDTFEKARIEYEYDGHPYEMELALAELIKNDNEKKKTLLDIGLRYHKINKETYDYDLLKLTHPDEESTEFKLEKLDLDFQYNKITEDEYAFEVANAKDEPYFNVVNFEFDSGDPSGTMAFELDWNDKWVEVLKEHGYRGATPALIVQQWFDTVCQTIAIEMGMFDNNTPFDNFPVSTVLPNPDPQGRTEKTKRKSKK